MSAITAVSPSASLYPTPGGGGEPSSTIKADEGTEKLDARGAQQAQNQLTTDQAGKAKQTVIASDKSALSRAQAVESQGAAMVARDQNLLDVTV